MIGKKNISFGWMWILVGLMVGAVMGMWSFNGPLPSPVGDYSSLPRRMLRLSHIAFVALAIINILYGQSIDKLRLDIRWKKLGSICMIFGAMLMPIFLIAASFYEPLKYLTWFSASLIILGVGIMAIGKLKS